MSIEKKYCFARSRQRSALHLAKRLLQPDPDYPYSVVYSLYFDTLDHDFLGEKANSDYLKQKARIRWYDCESAAATSAYIEIKRKNGNRREKLRHRLEIPADGMTGLGVGRGGKDSVTALIREVLGEDIPTLFPVLTIRYDRHRFKTRLNSERINLDTRISTRGSGGVRLPRSGWQTLHNGVLEVKGEHAAASGPVTQIIESLHGKKTAFSKYLEAYEALHGE